MKKILILCTIGVFSLTAKAQIPTIDVSSLQQLVQQYQTMQQQLSTAQNVLSTSTSILGTDNNILNQALGTVNNLTGNVTGWLGQFTSLQNMWNQTGNWFENQALAPIQNFDNNITYWAGQVGSNPLNTPAAIQACWNTSVQDINQGVAVGWQRDMALAGYNARLVNNAQTSQTYGSNVLAQGQSVLQNTASGTLIEQAAANNTLLYQQTALLDKMKNDVNDATVAEAADRDAKIKAQKEEWDLDTAVSQGSME